MCKQSETCLELANVMIHDSYESGTRRSKLHPLRTPSPTKAEPYLRLGPALCFGIRDQVLLGSPSQCPMCLEILRVVGVGCSCLCCTGP
jgi:hypothetical protein